MSRGVQVAFHSPKSRTTPVLTHAIEDPAAFLIKKVYTFIDAGMTFKQIKESTAIMGYRIGLSDSRMSHILGGGESTYRDLRARLGLVSNQVGSWTALQSHSKCDIHTFILILHGYQTGQTASEIANFVGKKVRTINAIFCTAEFPDFSSSICEKTKAVRSFLEERRKYLTEKLGEPRF